MDGDRYGLNFISKMSVKTCSNEFFKCYEAKSVICLHLLRTFEQVEVLLLLLVQVKS